MDQIVGDDDVIQRLAGIGLVEAWRDQACVTGGKAPLQGPIQIPMAGEDGAVGQGQEAVGVGVIAVVDHDGDGATGQHRREAPGPRAVGVDNHAPVTKGLVPNRASHVVEGRHIAPTEPWARAWHGQDTRPQSSPVVVVEGARADDDHVGAGGGVEGEDIVDHGVANDRVGADNMDDDGHNIPQPRLMRAMGWMFISGLSSW